MGVMVVMVSQQWRACVDGDCCCYCRDHLRCLGDSSGMGAVLELCWE